jgi:hypothetical protein
MFAVPIFRTAATLWPTGCAAPLVVCISCWFVLCCVDLKTNNIVIKTNRYARHKISELQLSLRSIWSRWSDVPCACSWREGVFTSNYKYGPSPIFFPLAPLLGSSPLYWSTGLITQFLDLSQAVWLLEWVIRSLQGFYLNTGQHKHRKTRTHIKHPCPRWDSNSQSWPPSNWRLFITQTTWLPRLAKGKFIPV